MTLVVSLLVVILLIGLAMICLVDPAKYPNAREIGKIMFLCALLSICLNLRELYLALR